MHKQRLPLTEGTPEYNDELKKLSPNCFNPTRALRLLGWTHKYKSALIAKYNSDGELGDPQDVLYNTPSELHRFIDGDGRGSDHDYLDVTSEIESYWVDSSAISLDSLDRIEVSYSNSKGSWAAMYFYYDPKTVTQADIFMLWYELEYSKFKSDVANRGIEFGVWLFRPYFYHIPNAKLAKKPQLA